MTPRSKLYELVKRRKDLKPFLHDGLRPEDSGSDIENLFWDHDGPVIHKWLHYLPIYEANFAPFRDQPIRMLEIGVSKGGSLSLWRKYFGPQATIFGIDIDPDCAAFDGLDGAVRIGSQTDRAFLEGVLGEMGGLDIVLDDGSHHSQHIRESLHILFPHLSVGGVYMIEDLHAAYWPSHGGGLRRKSSFMRDVADIIDDMHHWYHNGARRNEDVSKNVGAVHVYDSIVVLDKVENVRPSHVRRGRDES